MIDIQTLWEFILKNSHHIEIINAELGAIKTSVDWLTWWMRGITGGIGILIISSITNIVLTKKNGKR